MIVSYLLVNISFFAVLDLEQILSAKAVALVSHLHAHVHALTLLTVQRIIIILFSTHKKNLWLTECYSVIS